MADKKYSGIPYYLLALITGVMLVSSCGKSANNNAVGLNIQYRIVNLSPDLFPVSLYVNFNPFSGPYIYGVDQGYFSVTSIDTPYQIRSALSAHTPILSRADILKPNLKYTLYIIGNVSNNSVKSLFTIDTASLPAIGHGKIRFVNVSPTATAGLDATANGTPAFTKVVYNSSSKYLEMPVGSYNFKITNTGSATILKELPTVTIEDGRLYTIYSYGYATRVDSAAFNAGLITNR